MRYGYVVLANEIWWHVKAGCPNEKVYLNVKFLNLQLYH